MNKTWFILQTAKSRNNVALENLSSVQLHRERRAASKPGKGGLLAKVTSLSLSLAQGSSKALSYHTQVNILFVPNVYFAFFLKDDF